MRYLTLGPGLTTPGGYTPDVGEPVATPEDVVARFDLLRTIGAVGIKVFIERGFGLRPVWPIHAPEMRAAIVRASGKAPRSSGDRRETFSSSCSTSSITAGRIPRSARCAASSATVARGCSGTRDGRVGNGQRLLCRHLASRAIIATAASI